MNGKLIGKILLNINLPTVEMIYGRPIIFELIELLSNVLTFSRGNATLAWSETFLAS